MKKGILGFKKDPKNQMLFFANGESWPSDDSNDSDFVDPEDNTPSAEQSSNKKSERTKVTAAPNNTVETQGKEKLLLKCRKIRNHQKGKSKQVKWEMDCGRSSSLDNRKESESLPRHQTPWGDILPYEVILRIMQFVVRSEGPLPFLESASKVSELWSDVSSHPSLWDRVDCSLYRSYKIFTEHYLQKLCKERFCHTRELILSGCDSQVTARTIKAISENCSALTAINFSGCKQMNAKLMEALVDNCPNLVSIDLSHVSSHASSTSPVSFNSIKYVVGKCGVNLKYLNFAGNVMLRVANSLTVIGELCPNLTELDMSNVMTNDRSTIPINIEKLQNGCPNLKILRFANVQLRLASTPLVEQAQSPGFPKLEELSIARTSSQYYQGLDDSALERIIKCSNKLKLLDVRGCSRITASGLIRFPAFDLEYLFLSQCPGAITPGIELVMQKWCHSLVEVDLSWNHSGESVDAAVLALASPSKKSVLHTLNLSGSAVTFEPVKAVLNFCPKLESLTLSSCRGLPRGIKRHYKGDDLQKFREDTEGIKDTKDGEVLVMIFVAHLQPHVPSIQHRKLTSKNWEYTFCIKCCLLRPIHSSGLPSHWLFCHESATVISNSLVLILPVLYMGFHCCFCTGRINEFTLFSPLREVYRFVEELKIFSSTS